MSAGRRVAILSQGPGAAAYVGQPYDVLIGVNRQAAAWRCDWWAANDAATLMEVKPLGRPQIWTKAAALSHMADTGHMDALERLWRHSISTQEMSIPARYLWRLVPRWNAFSGPAAVGLALTMKPLSLDLYGFDMAGDSDFGGQTRACRNADRWRREGAVFDRLMKAARERGIRVCRV